ncbi:hypothetical protein LguiA_031378 [Lonicera macranthoides]
MSGRKKKTEKAEDEVEELLRAAEDSMLLKLSVNSHMSRGSSSTIIDPDLDRRFQALRYKPNHSSKSNPNPQLPNPPPSISSVPTDLNLNSDYNPQGGDDLFARFTALKSSIPAHSSSPSLNEQQKKFEDGDDDDEDEVEKLIRWAVDAARLDPSPPSDTDHSDGEDDTDQSDDEDRVDSKKKKGKRK